jgi:hypothetical protein
MEAGGFALAILGDVNNSLCDDLTHYRSRPEILKRFAGIVESLAHRQGRGVVEPNFWIGVIAIGTSRKHERERRSVSQSPRLEAVSVMAESVPLMVSRLIKLTTFGWRADIPIKVFRRSLEMTRRPVILFQSYIYKTFDKGSAQCAHTGLDEKSNFLRQSSSSIRSEC